MTCTTEPTLLLGYISLENYVVMFSSYSYLIGMNMAMKQATGLATAAIVAARW